MTRTCPPTNLYHENDPYRRGNSLVGLEEARIGDYDWIDWDAQESKDQEFWNMHWSWLYQDKFHVTHGGILLRTGRRRVRTLVRTELSQVVSSDGYKPHPYSFMLKRAAQAGKNLEIELKCFPSDRAIAGLIEHIWNAQQLCPDFKVRIKILQGVLPKRKIITTFKLIKAINAVRATNDREANIHTLYLNHTNKPVTLTLEQTHAVDLVRGKWKAI